MRTRSTRIVGLEPTALETLWNTRTDHRGNLVESFVDRAGDWPLRCCLQDSRPGEALAIVAWSPFPWNGAYAETGPVVVHAERCEGPDGYSHDRVPKGFRGRRQLLRPYGHDRRIAYDHIRIVDPEGDLDSAIDQLLGLDSIAFVHSRNVLSGCYSFTAERTSSMPGGVSQRR